MQPFLGLSERWCTHSLNFGACRVALRPISAHRLKAPSTRINGALEPGVAIPRHYLPLIGAVRGCDSL